MGSMGIYWCTVDWSCLVDWTGSVDGGSVGGRVVTVRSWCVDWCMIGRCRVDWGVISWGGGDNGRRRDDFGIGWVRVGSARLVGRDGGTEAALIGDVIYFTVDAVGISESIAALLVTIGVTFFVLVVAVSISVIDIVSEVVWLRGLSVREWTH